MMSRLAPKVSVCIPVFNRESNLEEAIRSVLTQTYDDFELCIQDNSSTDRSWEVARSFADPRVRPERNDSNVGFVANFNKTFLRSRGQYVRPLCSDDLMDPTCLARQVEFLDAHPDVGVVFTEHTAIDERGMKVGGSSEAIFSKLPDVLDTPRGAAFYFREGCVTMVSASMAPRKRFGLFDLSYRHACDWAKWAELLSTGPIGIIKERLSRFRLHPGQISSGPKDELIDETFRVLRRLEPMLPAGFPAAEIRRNKYAAPVLELAVRRGLAGHWAEALKILGSIHNYDSLTGAAVAWPHLQPKRLTSWWERRLLKSATH